jgi:hypothetical protein
MAASRLPHAVRDVTCTAIYNEAIFHKTFSANYKQTDYKILIMQGKDKDAPVHHEGNIVLEMITTDGLAKGTYPVIAEEDLGSYYSHRFVRADRCTLQRMQTTGRYRDYSR